MSAKTFIGSNQVKKVFVGNNEIKKIYAGSKLVYEYESIQEPLIYYTEHSTFELIVPNGYRLCKWQTTDSEPRYLYISQNDNTISDGYIMSGSDSFPVNGGDRLYFDTNDMHTNLYLEITLT